MASPPVAAWMIRGADQKSQSTVSQTLGSSAPAVPVGGAGATKVAVEVVAKGSAPQWIYIDVPSQAIPEPSSVMLLAAASVLLLRRRRSETA